MSIKEYLGEIRAYNWEAIWLSTNEYDEVDDAEEWWKCIKDDYEKLKKRDMKLYIRTCGYASFRPMP